MTANTMKFPTKMKRIKKILTKIKINKVYFFLKEWSSEIMKFIDHYLELGDQFS